MYQDLSCVMMTGAPVCEKVVEMTWKKHLNKLSVPPVAFKISFHSCALCWVRLMIFLIFLIDLCFPLVFYMLLSSTNPSIPMIVVKTPSGSL